MTRGAASQISFDDEDIDLIADSLWVSIDDIDRKMEKDEIRFYEPEDIASMKAKRVKLVSLLQSISWATTTKLCPECSHRMTVEHDADEPCPECDEAAQLGQYAPCADLSDGKVLVAGVLYDEDTLDEADPQ